MMKSISHLSKRLSSLNLGQLGEEILKLQKYLLAEPNPYTLFLLDKLFKVIIPFNAPHDFKIQSVKCDEVKVKVPFQRSNMNHIKSIHACAMATVGEFCAGLLILRNFELSKYRLILSKLDIDYHYQGKTDLMGSAVMSEEEINELKNELDEKKSASRTLTTSIFDKKENLVATVKSTWQLKDWEQVRTKI